jgi:acetoin utilization deacetylase AcuC-like enzyme
LTLVVTLPVLVLYNAILTRYFAHVTRFYTQGNGNAVLFAGNSAVYTFSMHCSANYFSAKQSSDLDVEVPAGTGDAEYLALLRTKVTINNTSYQ